MIDKKTISDFLNNEYKDFSLYTIENRSISSVIDGFKIVNKKIIQGSLQIWKTGNEKTLKIFQLSGYIANTMYYHHGDASLSSSIINMAQKFKNNIPLLEEDGQFGDLRSPEAGAPRYIGTKLSKNFRLIYKDFELLEYKYEEGERIEPKFFLPIIPMILVNGSTGISVGFFSNILSRCPNDIITACESYINGKKIKSSIIPKLPEFTGSFIQDPENNKRWVIRGKLNILNTTHVKVSELPPSMTFEKWELLLDDLIDKKSIVSYEDRSGESIDYIIRFEKETLAKLGETGLIKLLKLEESQTEFFTTLDQFGKLKIFDSEIDIIKYFVNFRIEYYERRKNYLIGKLQSELEILKNRSIFIWAIIKNKIEIKNKPKSDIIIQIESLKIPKIDDSYDYLLRLPISSLTKEVYDKLLEDIKNKENEILTIKNTDPKKLYLSDLSELKKQLKL